MPELVDAVSRGVLAAGALPCPFPTISLGEVFLHPTAMLYRNLMAMDTEEMIRAQPMDAVVLIGGCDKTVPAQLMGAASAGVPAIQLVTGPMSTGRHRGERLGACTDCRSYWARYRAGSVDAEEIAEVEGRLSVTAGTCAVMGTASTMAWYLPIPKKLAMAGVTDILRVSDARMSGTAFGSVVLHVAPEAAVGGPLAAVRNGDRIRLSVSSKRIDLLVDESEIRRRLANVTPTPPAERGYQGLYRRSVLQASDGCDFDFLVPRSGDL